MGNFGVAVIHDNVGAKNGFSISFQLPKVWANRKVFPDSNDLFVESQSETPTSHPKVGGEPGNKTERF